MGNCYDLWLFKKISLKTLTCSCRCWWRVKMNSWKTSVSSILSFLAHSFQRKFSIFLANKRKSWQRIVKFSKKNLWIFDLDRIIEDQRINSYFRYHRKWVKIIKMVKKCWKCLKSQIRFPKHPITSNKLKELIILWIRVWCMRSEFYLFPFVCDFGRTLCF